MLRRLTILSGLAVAAALAPSPVSAGSQSPFGGPQSPAAVQQMQWWDFDRCRGWRRECAERWGWRTERWHRCLARHGCGRYRYGDRWD